MVEERYFYVDREKKAEKMKKILCIIIVICLLILSSCTGRTQDKGDKIDNIDNTEKVKLFDEISSIIDTNEYPASYDTEEKFEKQWEVIEKNHEKIEENLEKLGLGEYYPDEYIEAGIETIGDEFIEEYLNVHTSSELLNDFLKIYSYIRDESNYKKDGSFNIYDEEFHKSLDKCLCKRYSNFLKLILKYLDYEIISFDENMKGQNGYYTQHPEAEPQSFTEEVSGKFNSVANDNEIYRDTRTNVGTVEYYGDFAILTVKGYSYDAGAYEWENGVFVDVLPSWEPLSECNLYYKGICIYRGENISDILNENIEFLDFFDINGKLYEGIKFNEIKVEEDTSEKRFHTFLLLDEY